MFFEVRVLRISLNTLSRKVSHLEPIAKIPFMPRSVAILVFLKPNLVYFAIV